MQSDEGTRVQVELYGLIYTLFEKYPSTPKAMRMLVSVMIKHSTALIPPHTSAVVASSLVLLDAVLAWWW